MRLELLLLRLEVLKRGVEDVQEVLEAGKAAPAAIQAAKDKVNNAEWFVSDVVALAQNEKVRGALADLRGQAGGEFKNELKKIDDVLQNVRKEGGELIKDLEDARDNLKQIDDRAVHFAEGFGSRIGKQTNDLAFAIDELIRDDSEPTELWRTFFDEIHPKAMQLFTEYLDLLGGVSIRERGLTLRALKDVVLLDDLCLLADWHFANELTLCVDWDRPAHLAIPGRDAANEVPAWPILRLGFASWSVWGLPLEGHQFGKLLAETSLTEGPAAKQWKEHLTSFGEVGTRLLIADTIAAWAEGPAYACALLFLVLNPGRVADGSATGAVSDLDRAELVLAALDSRIPQAQGRGPRPEGGYGYLPFLHRLRTEWRRACKPATAEVSVERAAQLGKLATLVQRHFVLTKPFDLHDWRLSATVLGHLLRNENVPSDLAAGVRHLTNAAWRGRLGGGKEQAHDRGAPHIGLDELEQRALREGMAFIERRPSLGLTAAEPSVLRERPTQL